jgi:hypothetical protein
MQNYKRKTNMTRAELDARYLAELSRLRAQAERQSRPAIVKAFDALIERKQAKGGK